MKVKRALISVSNKTGLEKFARELVDLGITIISTGGTAKILTEFGIKVTEVATITDFPEIMDGRVKTLHPKIHGGILGERDIHQEIATKHNIEWIDLVVVNLYPFAEVIKSDNCTLKEAIANIDIGGPALIRSAAKNMAFTTVVVNPDDYDTVVQELKATGEVCKAKKAELAKCAFKHTSMYDRIIYEYLDNTSYDLELSPIKTLRYGENPHQKACALRIGECNNTILDSKQFQGKELSYNNIVDGEAASSLVNEFDKPACVIVKHANPCGVAISSVIYDAFLEALSADSQSAFGGIIAFNKECCAETAAEIVKGFYEVVIAPSFAAKALNIFAKKPNLRIIAYRASKQSKQYKSAGGLLLAQDSDTHNISASDLNFLTRQKATDPIIEELLFSWKVVKYVKSNAIVISKRYKTIGVGPGQVSRVKAVELAIAKAENKTQDAVLASDAFFPFPDSIEMIAKAGIKAIIQPGGSLKDNAIIDACDKHNIAMGFTNIRAFNH